jgi:hypothetical protein
VENVKPVLKVVYNVIKLKTVQREDVKMDTDLLLTFLVKCVLKKIAKNVTIIKTYVHPALTDGEYGILRPQEKKLPEILNVNNVKLDVLNVIQIEKYVLFVIQQAFCKMQIIRFTNIIYSKESVD